MPVKAGQIVIDITTGTAKFVQDMEANKGTIREFGKAGVSEAKATSAAFKVLEGGILNNSRAAEYFAEKMLGVGEAAKYAFPVVSGIAFIGMVVEASNKAREFFRELGEAPEKITKAFRGLVDPIRTSNDELQVANDRLENDIAKLEGRPQNNLKLALDEARKSADDLADSLDKGLDNLNKLLKEQGIANWKAMFGMAGTDDIANDFKKFKEHIDEITDEGGAAIREATDAKSRDAAQTALNTRLLAEYSAQLTKVNGLISQAETVQAKHDHPDIKPKPATSYVPGSIANEIPPDQSGVLAGLRNAARFLRHEQDSIGLRSDNGSLTNRKEGLDAGADARKEAEQELLRLAQELAQAKAAQADSMERIDVEERNELERLQTANQINEKTLNLVHEIYDTKRVTESNRLLEVYKKNVDELNQRFAILAITAKKSLSEALGADVADGVKRLEEGAKAVTKWAEAYNKLTAQTGSESVRHRVAMAGIEGNPNDPLGTLRTQQDIQRADIQDRYEQKLKNANSDRERSIALLEQELDLQKLQDEMEERTAAARHKNLADFMREMQGAGKTAGDILYESANSALDRVSDQFGKLITGQKTNFGRMLQDIGQDMTKEATKSLMQKGLGALGKLLGVKAPEGKPDGTKSNPFHVIVDGDGKPVNPLAGLVPSLPGALGGSGGLKGILGGVGGWLGKIFGGASSGGTAVSSSIKFMAGGGDADPGHIYGVAEAGEAELISPKSSSRITPLSKAGLGGVTNHHHYEIDARGAQFGVENRIAYAIDSAHSSAVSNSVKATSERSKRTPRRS